MPESATHLGLVQQLVSWIETHCSNKQRGLLFVDDPSQVAADKPPRILGYLPDVYWKTPEGRSVLIGEAKSAYDVESRHSRKQFASFFSHLRSVEEGTLLIAVPWHVVPQAKSLIRAIQRDTGSITVRTIFIDYLPG